MDIPEICPDVVDDSIGALLLSAEGTNLTPDDVLRANRSPCFGYLYSIQVANATPILISTPNHFFKWHPGLNLLSPGVIRFFAYKQGMEVVGIRLRLELLFSKELDLMPVVSSFITRKMGNGEATKLSKRILVANGGRSIPRMALTGKTLYRELLLS